MTTSTHRIALRPTSATTFELETDRQHPILVVRPFTVQLFDAQGRTGPDQVVWLPQIIDQAYTQGT